MTRQAADVQELEISLFLEALARHQGYDFRHYAKASLRRRVLALTAAVGCRNVSELIPRVIHEENFLRQVLSHLSVPVSEFFRDPPVFRALRETVVPLLHSYPRINVWLAGCANGEEAYSLAILLREEGLLERTQIYATDINDVALQKAEDGIFPSRDLADMERNYREGGGKADFSDYYNASYGFIRMADSLRKNIVFAHHNLVSDGVFCEVQMIMCRNVMIYFDEQLQNRVLKLFHESLTRGGFLCLGNRESLRHTDARAIFTTLDQELRIFRRAEEGRV
ncbi:protein-glutamate O-methyltransferase CheR [Telmatospirillum sp. J64-1]|uniref:CheR family methyltransferase n=1 Tax=Telmatospirillum sp. J64-1 TaxID=2502183 RepID=UPI00115F5EC8|nr:protein-glutamate O-methyltransferase CheR [Telmatospirillum sp. J64-1]